MSIGETFFAFKNRMTERSSHLAGELSGSSILSDCYAGTGRPKVLRMILHCGGETEECSAVVKFRLATHVPKWHRWRPYFSIRPRTVLFSANSTSGNTTFQRSGVSVNLATISTITLLNLST